MTPQRLFEFMRALTALSREHGVVVSGNLIERDTTRGGYALNLNNDGPELGWLDPTSERARKT